MNFLEHELVRKYFDEGWGAGNMSYHILDAMQEPIRKGERMIWFDYCVDEWKEGIANIDYKPRPDHLRLPDKFQRRCEHKTYPNGYCSCETNQPPPAPERVKYDCKVCEGCGQAMTSKEYGDHCQSGCKPADSEKCDCPEGLCCKVCDPEHFKVSQDSDKAVEEKIKDINEEFKEIVRVAKCCGGIIFSKDIDLKLHELVAVARKEPK